MLSKPMIPIALLFFFLLAVSTSHAIPFDDNGAVMDIDHNIYIPFWQMGNSGSPAISGWGCNKYADHGIVSGCTDSTNHYAHDGSIGEKGCAITSLTTLYWYHGSWYFPEPSLPWFDPGKLNDWMVDNHTYYPNKDVI